MTRWLMAAVLIAPLVIAPGPIASAKNAAVLVLALGLVAWRGQNRWLRAFAALAMLSTLGSGAAAAAWAGLLGILTFLLVLQEVARRSDGEWGGLRRVIAAAAGLQIVWMGVQALGLDPIFAPVAYGGGELSAPAPVQGWFGNPSDTALYLSLSLPALVAVSPWLLLPAGAALASLKSTAGLVGAVIVAGWLACRCGVRAGALLILALLAAAVLFVLHLDPQGLGVRPTGWGIAARLAWVRPVTGWGPNALDSPVLRVVHERTGEPWNFLFNEWLQGAMELGLAAPLLAAGYLASLARRLRGKWAACGEALPAVVVLLAVSLFSIPLRVGPTALLAACYLGRLEAVAAKETATTCAS